MAKKNQKIRPTPNELDPLIHERLRLGILSALVVQDLLSFTELRELLQTTDGNLGVQARKLEEAGYIICDKRFQDRKPKSTYRLSAGRAYPRWRNISRLSPTCCPTWARCAARAVRDRCVTESNLFLRTVDVVVRRPGIRITTTPFSNAARAPEDFGPRALYNRVLSSYRRTDELSAACCNYHGWERALG